MKIAIAQNFFKPYNKGGAENLVIDMMSKLKAQGHEVFLITTKPKDEKKLLEYKDEIKTYRLASSCHSLDNKKYIIRFFWHFSNIYNLKRKKALIKILKQEKTDLCISHNLIGLGLFLPKITNSLNIKHIHFLHDIQLLHPSGLMMWGHEDIINSHIASLYQLINKYFFKDIYKVISPSSWLIKEHINKGFFKNAIAEIKPLKKISETKINSNYNKSFLFVGQVEHHKGIDFLIDSFKEIENKDIKLKIVGEGKLLKKLKKENINDKRIEFLGKLDKNGVRNEMKNSSALIVPSICYENSPTVIYEAKEIGLKVIASALGGINELIENPEMLFTPSNKEDLKSKIQKYL